MTTAQKRLAELKAELQSLQTEERETRKVQQAKDRKIAEDNASEDADAWRSSMQAENDDETVALICDLIRRQVAPQRATGARGGAKATIFDKSAISVMRALGAANYTRPEAKMIVAELCDKGADALAEASYATSMSHGRTYDSSREISSVNRAPAELTTDEWAQCDVACGRCEAPKTTKKSSRKKKSA